MVALDIHLAHNEQHCMLIGIQSISPKNKSNERISDGIPDRKKKKEIKFRWLEY